MLVRNRRPVAIDEVLAVSSSVEGKLSVTSYEISTLLAFLQKNYSDYEFSHCDDISLAKCVGLYWVS